MVGLSFELLSRLATKALVGAMNGIFSVVCGREYCYHTYGVIEPTLKQDMELQKIQMLRGDVGDAYGYTYRFTCYLSTIVPLFLTDIPSDANIFIPISILQYGNRASSLSTVIEWLYLPCIALRAPHFVGWLYFIICLFILSPFYSGWRPRASSSHAIARSWYMYQYLAH